MRLLPWKSTTLEGQEAEPGEGQSRNRKMTAHCQWGCRASSALRASQPATGTLSSKMLTLVMKHFLLEKCL